LRVRRRFRSKRVYIGVAILWLWLVDKVTPTTADWVGVGISFLGMAVIMFGSRVESCLQLAGQCRFLAVAIAAPTTYDPSRCLHRTLSSRQNPLELSA
jgi:hypothetical protein